MASFRVPNQQASVIAKLISLPHDVLSELGAALKHTPIDMSPDESIRGVLSAFESIEEGAREDITVAIYSLYMVRASSELPLNEFIDDIAEAITESDHEDLIKIPEEVIENSKPYLVSLLGSDSLFVSAKAVLILYENDSVFTEARVITEARPVFGEDIDESPKAALLVHTLRIHHLHDRRQESIYLALETKELQKLIDVLERAKQKAESLRATLERANVSLLERK